MNNHLYRVMSEQSTELVIAKNRSEACYLAWRKDKRRFGHDIKDMPRFATYRIVKNISHKSAIVSDNPRFKSFWE